MALGSTFVTQSDINLLQKSDVDKWLNKPNTNSGGAWCC